jgi:hypothetical protein
MSVLQLLKILYAALPDLLLHLKILHKLPLLFKIYDKLRLLQKIHHLHNLLSIILLSIVLLFMVILQSLLLTLPLLLKNPPQTTSPPENLPSIQPLEHHSPQHCSPPHGHSPKSPPHTTPPLQNPLQTTHPPKNSPSIQPLEHHSPKSPPHTTPPPLQNPPNALKKQDAIVYEPSKDTKTILEKFYDGHKNYKTKKLLEDLALEGMTDLALEGMIVEEFWQHGDKDYREFEYGKPLVPKHVHLKLPWIVQKLHKWYYLACVYGLNFVQAKIPRDIFNTLDFDQNVKLVELHTIYHLQMLDITMMTVWCL